MFRDKHYRPKVKRSYTPQELEELKKLDEEIKKGFEKMKEKVKEEHQQKGNKK